MRPFVRLTAIAAPLDEADVDTNQLCPTRFNKVPYDAPDFHRILMHDRRFTADGAEVPGFVLNREPFRRAGILVVDRNFGCGSSRESAVIALLAFGIRAVIAPSFGDIFFKNALRNGLVPVAVPEAFAAAMRTSLRARPGADVTVDLEAERVTGPDGAHLPFALPARARRCLMKGIDEIALTEEFRPEIDTFERDHAAAAPWLFEGGR